jgi:hypothetical protein
MSRRRHERGERFQAPSCLQTHAISKIQQRRPPLFRAPQKTWLIAAALLWAAQAGAGSRVTLLPFEGDSARPLRWRVAKILKTSGNTVLAFSPPQHPESRAALQAYAQRRDVDVFVSGEATEGERGWRLALTVRDANGKQLGSPLEFRGSTLGNLVRELKDEGQDRLDQAIHGRSAAPPTVLPLPRRARSAPAPAPSTDEAAEAPPAARPAPASQGAQSWDADADDTPSPPPKSKRPSKAVPKEQDDPAPPSKPSRPDRGSAAALRLAMANSAASPDSSPAARSSAGRTASRSRAAEADSDPAPAPAHKAAPRAAAAEDSGKALDPVPGQVVMDADADPADDASGASAENDSASSNAKPSKGRLASLFRARGAQSESSQASGETAPLDAGSSDAQGEKSLVPSVVLGAQAGLVRRQLSYQNDIYRRLRAPTTNDWVYQLDGEFFPFARPVKEHLSIVASFESTLAGKVHDGRVDRNFDVTFSELAAGMHFRQALGPHEIGLEATLARLSTGLDDPGHLAGVPEFSYTLLTPTLDAKLHFGAVSLRGAVGYRRALGSYGEASTADWFPHMTGYGIDGQLGFEYRLSEQVAFEATGLLRRFILQMNSKPADAIGGIAEVAQGAVDSYLGAYFGLTLRL